MKSEGHSEDRVSSYPEDHPQGQFDRYFEGIWRPKWWRRLIGVDPPQLVKIKSYDTGEVTGELRTVYGVSEDGDRFGFLVQGRRSILGWVRVDG